MDELNHDTPTNDELEGVNYDASQDVEMEERNHTEIIRDLDKVITIGGETKNPVKSYRYIPGTIYDNPIGLEQNKDYISTLKALPPVESRRLLYGAWVREQRSGFFKREWLEFVNQPNIRARRRCRAWDLAFSEISEAKPRCDATAGVLLSKEDATSQYTVEHVVTMRKRVHDVEKMIFQTAEQDGRDCIIGLPLDPGATAGAYCRNLAKELGERGFIVKMYSM